MIGPGRVWRAPAAVKRAVVAHARRDRPNECCGLLLGAGGRIDYALPLANRDVSPTRFRIDDATHIDWRRRLRGLTPRLEIVGVYHSHPAGSANPSASDLAESLYPDWVYLIVGLRSQAAEVRAFRIRSGRARPLVIRWR